MKLNHRHGQLDQAKDYLSMYLSLFPAHVRVFIPLIRHGIRNGETKLELQNYWRKMRQLRVPLNALAYNSMVSALMELQEFDVAEKYVSEFKRTRQPFTLEFYQTMLVMYGKQGKITEMEALYDQVTKVISLNAKSSLMLLNALMAGYSYGGVWKKVWVLWNRLLSSHAARIHQDAKILPRYAEVFNNLSSEIVMRHYGVNAITVCIIVDTLGYTKQLKRLREIWKDLEKRQFPFVLNNLTSYMEALLRCEQHKEAIELVLNLKAIYGMEPDSKMLRNCLTLISPQLYNDVKTAFQKAYPHIHLNQTKTLPPAKMSLADTNLDSGLPMNDFQNGLLNRNGVWLLPPIRDLVE
jgi:hypothetical protein